MAMAEMIEGILTKLWALGEYPSHIAAWDLLFNLPPGTNEELIVHLERQKQIMGEPLRRSVDEVFAASGHDHAFGKSSSHMDDYYDNEVTSITNDSRAAQRRYDRLIDVVRKVMNPDAAELYRHPAFDEACAIVIPDFNEISLELIEYFSLHPEKLADLHWRRFEELLDAIFKNQGYTTYLGPGSGDGGVDIRLIQKDSIGEVLTLVQAKRRKREYSIKLEAVAALYGVVEAEQANRGLFVSTSEYLPSALKFAEQKKHKLKLAGTPEIAKWCRDITAKR
jgi:hypothetical protein